MQRTGEGDQSRVALYALLVVVSTCCFVFFFRGTVSRLFLPDFSIYWQSTRVWLTGQNPYDLPYHWTYVTGDVGGVDTTDKHQKVWAPPYFLLPLTPFAMLSLATSKAVFVGFVVAGCCGWMFLTVHQRWIVTKTRAPLARSLRTLLDLAALPYGTWVSTLVWGGAGFLMPSATLLLAITGALCSEWLWCLYWAMMAIKPHTAIFGTITLMWFLPAAHRRTALRALALVASTFVIVLWLVSPHVVGQYVNLDSSLTYRIQGGTVTLLGLLLSNGVTRPTAYLACGIGVLTLLWLVTRRNWDHTPKDALALSFLVNTAGLFLSPYGWYHDYQNSAGWLWATMVLGAHRRPLGTLNAVTLIALNAAFFTARGKATEQWGAFVLFGLTLVNLAWLCLGQEARTSARSAPRSS